MRYIEEARVFFEEARREFLEGVEKSNSC